LQASSSGMLEGLVFKSLKRACYALFCARFWAKVQD
jgi:hypothetical protein